VGGVLQDVDVNEIAHQNGLASVNSPGVIKPNVDTVYSKVVLDLSKQDVVLTIPNITDRYWLYPVYDPFGNIIAEIGAVNNSTGGDYLIRRADDVHAAPGYEPSPKVSNSGEEYQGIVNMPSTYGTILARLLVLHNTTEDASILQGYQNATRLTPILRSKALKAANPAPDMKDLALNGSFLGINTLAQQLEFAAKIVPYAQAVPHSDRFRVASILSQAGLYDGHYRQPAKLNLTHVGVVANSTITLERQTSQAIQDQGNGWTLQRPSYQGDYGVNYASRAYVALAGYQQLTQHQALYPEFEGRGFSSVFQLESNESLLVTFSGKSQLNKTGFWSLTAYGANQYLIPNSIDRYTVGDEHST
jgi:hypothetical protein